MLGTNSLAPPAYSGIPNNAPVGTLDVDFTYPFDIVLTALQALRDQTVSIQTDADFIWRCITLNVFTGAFSVRFVDSQGFYLSNGQILSGNLSTDPSAPFPLGREIAIPAGGRIGIDITDLSNAGNTIQLLFRGVKRFRQQV